jgi:hypothetical protein
MQIIVNHLTQMNQGFICAAGIDLETHRHVRPRLRQNNLTRAFLSESGGYFELGASLDLGWVERSSDPPEVEDIRFNARRVQTLKKPNPQYFWDLLKSVSKNHLAEIFGPDLKPLDASAVVAEGKGTASLGCLLLDHPPEISLNNQGRLRLGLVDQNFKLNLSVTDLRFYTTDHTGINPAVVEQANTLIRQGGPVILSLGLSRAWRKGGHTLAYHWLQVNNLHFESNPLW